MQVNYEVDDSKLVARFASTTARVQAALAKKLAVLAIKLENHIKADKLSGQVLNVRTGALRRSIFTTIETGPQRIVATVASSSDVKYGRIHEYGGTINIPEITPVKAHALHFFVGGKDVFAMRARAHPVKMPERSFMRSALADMKDEIRAGIEEAMKESVK